MIDWLTMKTEVANLEKSLIELLRSRQGCVCKLTAEGQVEWATPSRDVVRSDSHQLQIHLTATHLLVMGSPARVHAGNNVFGSGNIIECASRMLQFFEAQLWCDLPAFDKWKVNRIDVTHNYDMGNAANCRQALMALRHAHGGRYQVKTESESVYWSQRSRRRKGKCYHKGPQLKYLKGQGATDVTDEQVAMADRLLRLELTLGSQWWADQSKPWYEFTEADFNSEHNDYFGKLIGSPEVTDMADERAAIINAALALGISEGQGKAAYAYWALLKATGYEHAKAHTSPRTHYRHLKVLHQAGLSFADFQAGRVISIRKKPLVLSQPCTSWQQLAA